MLSPKTDPGLSGVYTGTQNYLWQYPMERHDKYCHRLARAVYVNLVGPIVDFYAATVGKPENAMITPNGDAFAAFLDDADLQGQSLAQFLSSVRTSKTVTGCDFVLIDMPQADPQRPVITRRDQHEQNLRPYLVHIPREDMLNWRLDERGRPIEILFRREAPSQGSVLDENSSACTEQLRYWSLEKWIVFEKVEGHWIGVSTGRNSVGAIPVVPMYHVRLGAFRGDSLLRDAAKFAQLLTNWVSSFDENLESSMFPVPVFKSLKSPGDAGVGAATIMHLNPEEQEEFFYVSPDSGPFESGWKAFGTMFSLALRHMGIQGKALQTSGGANDTQSGVSKEWDFSEAEKILAGMAGWEEDAVKQILYFAGLYLGSEWKGNVQYARKYDLSTAKDLIDAMILLQSAGAPLSARQELMERAVFKLLTSLPEDRKAIITADIAAMKDPALEMPAPGGPGAEEEE